MATWYAKTGIANVDDANMWTAVSDGSGATASWAANGGGTASCVGTAGDTLNANGKAFTLNQSCNNIFTSSGTTQMAVSGTRTITGNVTYSGTSASGMITVGSGAALTITGAVTDSSSGYAIVQSGTGTVSVSAAAGASGTAISNTGSGYGISAAGSGALAITGLVSCTGAGNGVYNNSTSASHTLSGNIYSATGGGMGYALHNGTLAWTPYSAGAGASASAVLDLGGGTALLVYGSGVLHFGGDVSTSQMTSSYPAGCVAIMCWNGGTIQYTGAHSLAAGCQLVFTVSFYSALNLASLALANSGTFVVYVADNLGTLTTTSASVVNQSSTSYTAMIGNVTSGNRGIITGPTLPAAADVQSAAAQFGYAGSLLTPAYQTTATTQAADAATLTATTLNTNDTDTTVAFGASNGTAKSKAVYDAALVAQYATDQAAVTAGKADILNTRTILAIAGTYDVAAHDAATAAAQLATDRNTMSPVLGGHISRRQ